jgi:hypothetical protein
MMGLKKIFLSLLCSVLLAGWASAQDTTDTSQGSYFLSFVKKVYFNPTILLATQDFHEQHNVRVLVLPDLNGAEDNQITGFERGMQKIIRFLIEGDDEGSIRFYFDAEDTESPFSFVYAEELHCKFTTADKDSIVYLLNAPFQNATFNLNSHALFEASIEGALAYAGKCLQHVTAQCGEMPEHATTEINTKPLAISVHTTSGTHYDIDHKQHDLLESHYPKARDVFTDQDWYAPAKFMVAGESPEPIAIAIDKHETLFKKQNLVFRTVYNNQVIPIEPSSTNDTIKLILPDDLPSGNPVEVVVKYTSTIDSIQYTVGFFMVYVYEPKEVKLNILTANGYTLGTTEQTAIENQLKAVYDQVGVHFTVEKKEWMPDSEWSNNITIESSGLLSNYPPNLRDWVNGVQDLNDYDEDEYYLVFGLTTTELAGYMPRARNIGFVFAGATVPGKAAAHELGHGVYHLRHIFAEEELGLEAFKNTENVMDYADNPNDLHALYLHQWKFIDDPASVSWFGGDDEDGSAIYGQKVFLARLDENEIVHYTATISDVHGFYTPSGYSVSFGDQQAANWELENVKFDRYSGGVSDFTLNGIDYSGLYQFSDAGEYVFHFYMKSDEFDSVRKRYIDSKKAEGTYDGSTSIDSWYLINYINKHHSNGEIPTLRISWPYEKILLKIFSKDCGEYTCISHRNTLGGHVKDPQATIDAGKFKAPLKDVRSPLYLEELDPEVIDVPTWLAQHQGLVQDVVTANKYLCEYRRILNKGKYGARFLEKFNFNGNFKQELGIGFNFNGQTDTAKAQSFLNIARAYDMLDSNIISRIDSPEMEKLLHEILDYKLKNGGENFSSLEQTELYFNLLLGIQAKVNNQIRNLANSKDEDYIVEIIRDLLTDSDLALFNLTDRIKMINCIVSDWMWHDEEIVALRILNTAPPDQSTEILKELLKARTIYDAAGTSKYKNIFTALYHRVTGDENREYITVMFKLWYSSDYAQSDRPEYSYAHKPMVFDYDSKQVLGFYDSNWNVDKTDDFSKVTFTREIPSTVMNYPLANVPPANIYYAGQDLFNTLVNQNESYSYHPFQPIGLVSIDQDGENIQFPCERIPAFILYAFDDVNTSQNIRFASEIALDIVSAAVGVPPFLATLKHGLTAFKQLSRARKLILGVKTLEFTAGAANLILKYSCSEQNTACQRVQSFLTCVEVACLSGDAIYGVIVKRKAKKILAENMDQVRQMDNADEIEELLRKTADDVAELGQDFQKYLKKAIAADADLASKIANTSFKTGDNFVDIIIHTNSAGEFIIKSEGNANKILSKTELAAIMNTAPPGKKIRLLSCNDETAAKELSTLLGDKPFYASDGWVDIYEGGQVYSKNKFYKYQNGNRIDGDALTHNATAPSGLGNKVRMGVKSGNEVFGSIVKNGNKVEYTNPAGKVLLWSEQTASDIKNSINTSKNLPASHPDYIGRTTEAKVGEFLQQEGKNVEAFSQKIKRGANNSDAGDIDVMTADEIIEVKSSFSAWSGKKGQVNKFVNSSMDDFLNPYNKKVILYIDEVLTVTQKQQILDYIPSNVTLVNSLEELKLIIK